MAGSQSSPLRLSTSLSRLFVYIRLLFHIKASSEGARPSWHAADAQNQVDPPIPNYFPTDPAALCDLLDELARHIQSRLPDCEWLEEGAIRFVADRPVDVGEVANIFVGMRGKRKVAVKCYRFYQSSDYLPTYTVRALHNLWVRFTHWNFIDRDSVKRHWPVDTT